MLGHRRNYPLPGRLYPHGANFDSMISFADFEPTESEWQRFLELIKLEVEYSRQLEEMVFNSRSSDRKRYVRLQKRLYLDQGVNE